MLYQRLEVWGRKILLSQASALPAFIILVGSTGSSGATPGSAELGGTGIIGKISFLLAVF